MHVYMAKSAIENAGNGIFASCDIREGEIICESPVVVYSHELTEKPICDYEFCWGEPPKSNAIAFGIISFTNHSENPNGKVFKNYEQKVIGLTALRDIKKGEEITFKYSNVWF